MRINDRKPNRLQGYDYRRNGKYFFTICVKDRAHAFGEVINGEMLLNPYGKIAQNQWDWLAERYNYVVLHEWIIMPDHVHGVLEIKAPDFSRLTSKEFALFSENVKIKSLSELIGAYKTTSSKLIRESGLPEFTWHRSFHDRIIRNESALNTITRYIRNNPSNWKGNPDYSDKM
jgi:putative transposase